MDTAGVSEEVQIKFVKWMQWTVMLRGYPQLARLPCIVKHERENETESLFFILLSRVL
jgi:hypothetical protein